MTHDEMLEKYGQQKADEIAKANDLYNQKNELLDQNLAAQQAGLAKAQTNAQQGASISNDKLMKYLGQSAVASGAVTGQTGTNFINANNAYQQNRATINNNYSAQNSDLLQRYAGEKLQIGADALANETSILDKYFSREYQAERDAVGDSRYEDETTYSREQDQKSWDYQMERDAVSDSRYDTEYADKKSETEWLKEQDKINEDFTRAEGLLGMYLEDYMADGEIDENEKKTIEDFLDMYTNPDNPNYRNLGGKEGNLRDLYDMYMSSSSQTGSGTPKWGDFTSEDIRAGKSGDNFSLSFNGGSYTNLEVGSAAPEEIVTAAEKVPGNSVFIYGNNLYIKTASGGVRRIGGSGKGGIDNTGGKEGTRQYNNLYAAVEKAGFILG